MIISVYHILTMRRAALKNRGKENAGPPIPGDSGPELSEYEKIR